MESIRRNDDSEEKVAEMSKLLFDHIQGQINLADTKAQLTLAAGAILAALVLPLGKGVAFQLLGSTATIERLTAGIVILMFISLLASLYYALVAARPTLQLPEQRRTLLYFGHIAELSEEEFISRFLRQTPQDINESILSQVWVKAQIANRKFTMIRWSLTFLILTVVLWAMVQLLLAFTP